jgi:hypothetical protein
MPDNVRHTHTGDWDITDMGAFASRIEPEPAGESETKENR